jgi:hypothetical protein
MPDTDTSGKLEDLRNNITDKLGELHRRATHAKLVLSPSSYWKNPWVRLGIGAAVGLVLGQRSTGRTHESLAHAVVRSGLSAAAAVLVTRALTQPRGGDCS